MLASPPRRETPHGHACMLLPSLKVEQRLTGIWRWREAAAVLAEDLGVVPSSHVIATTTCDSRATGSSGL